MSRNELPLRAACRDHRSRVHSRDQLPERSARVVRLRLVALVVPRLFKFKTVRRLVFRTVSQTGVNYRPSSLSQGAQEPFTGGDRLPWSRQT